jgi:hypothetical protein
MERQGDEIHLTQDEARAGSKTNTVRYILAISLALVIVAFAVIWLIGTHNAPQGSHDAPISNQAPPTGAAG